MTVLVGVLCESGVVIGTDGAATLGAIGRPTIEQPVRKIDIVEGAVIVAGTGAVGLHQRFVEVMTQLARDGKVKKPGPVEAAKEMARASRADFDYTQAFKQRQDGTGLYPAVDYGALVAFWNTGKAHLVEFEYGTMQPEFKSPEGLWHASMGAGQPIADPFLGMMRKTFCGEGCPELPIARFITCWALEHTIDLNPGGINEPLSIAVLEAHKGVPSAQMLSGEELLEHRSSVRAAYDHLGEFAALFDAPDATVPR